MKFCKRYLFVFVVFVLLFATFSTTASAEQLNKNIKVNIYPYDNKYTYGQTDLYTIPGDDQPNVKFTQTNREVKLDDSTWHFRQRLTFVDNTGSALFEKGETYKFTVNNLVFWYSVGSYTISQEGFVLYYRYVYTDGTQTDIMTDVSSFNLTYNSANDKYSFTHTLTAEKDIYKIIVWLEQTYNVPDYKLNTTQEVSMGSGALEPYPFSATIDKEDKSVGLLGSIINWVKTISADVSSGFANMVKGITELPQKIADGIKNLFVPDKNYIGDYKGKWEYLLKSRFGAIYEVGTIMGDFVGNIQNSNATNTINLPKVNLNSVGIPFAFGGYDIQIVPNGFTTVVEICKKIISIACTFLFINGLRKRYDEVMGVEQ